MDIMQAQRNIRLLYAYKMFRSATIIMAVFVPFLQSNGLSLTEVFLTQTIFSVAVVAFEVPTGYLADHVGRTFSLRWGAILTTLGFGVYAIGTGFGAFAAAELVLAAGIALMSGADSALAAESLAAQPDSGQRAYLRFEARSNAYGDLFSGASAILGGLLATGSLRLPAYATMIVFAITIPIAFGLREQPRQREVGRNRIKDLLRIVKYSLHGHQEVKWLIVYGSVVAATTYIGFWLSQPYFETIGLPLAWFGAVLAGLYLARAIFARYVEQYERWLGRDRLLVSFIPLTAALYLAVGLSVSMVGLAFLFGFSFVRAVAQPVFRDYINAHLSDDIRATVFSVQNLTEKLLYAGLGPLVGYLTDTWSLQFALLASAILYGVMGGGVLLLMRRNRLI